MQLAGELTKISLPSLIQLLRNGELTGKVCLTQGANTAFIYVLDGKLVHVETDSEQGRGALLELFLWGSGSFSFVEADNVESMPHSLPLDEPVEKIIREGLAHLEKKKHLDQLRISSRTVLKPVARKAPASPVYEKLDGVLNLGEVAAILNLRRFDYIDLVYELVINGDVVVAEAQAQDDSVRLPSWVISRLKQDNPDISQAIVQMVIWVDRVKCWMYQADADLEKVIVDLGGAPQLETQGETGEGSDSKPGGAEASKAKASGGEQRSASAAPVES